MFFGMHFITPLYLKKGNYPNCPSIDSIVSIKLTFVSCKNNRTNLRVVFFQKFNNESDIISSITDEESRVIMRLEKEQKKFPGETKCAEKTWKYVTSSSFGTE